MAFELPVERRAWTLFQPAVYEAVMAIPFGEMRSYSRIAVEDRQAASSQEVGGAMGVNRLPIIIPCHRVEGKSGAMIGYSAVGGIKSKVWLLKMEHREIK